MFLSLDFKIRSLSFESLLKRTMSPTTHTLFSPRGEGKFNKLFKGEALLLGQPVALFVYYFSQKKVFFRVPSIDYNFTYLV